MSRHDWVGKAVLWKLCKGLKSDNIHKWYTHKIESAVEDETHKILWDLEIHTDDQIPATRHNLVLITKKKKKNYRIDFAVSVDHKMKTKESVKIDK